MTSFVTIAKPYAKAIFEITKKKKNIKLWKKMLLFCINIIKNKNFKIILKKKNFKNDIYKLLILLLKCKKNKNFINFIKILKINQRLHIVSYILNELVNLENIYKKKYLINITIAYKINNNEKKKLKSFFQKKYKPCILRIFINIKVIGGIIIEINGLTYNYSILEFLKNFK